MACSLPCETTEANTKEKEHKKIQIQIQNHASKIYIYNNKNQTQLHIELLSHSKRNDSPSTMQSRLSIRVSDIEDSSRARTTRSLLILTSECTLEGLALGLGLGLLLVSVRVMLLGVR
jgi:hypothetical protein